MYMYVLFSFFPRPKHPVYLEGHRFMQDNDPRHTSRRAQSFFGEEGVNWWKTPAESPDCNPIENLWHELEFIRREAKPSGKEDLVGRKGYISRNANGTFCIFTKDYLK